MAGSHQAPHQDPTLSRFVDEIGPADAGPVVVEGGRTRWAVGGAPNPDARPVSAPVGVVDYVPAEMTVTVRAGTLVAELDAALAESGQRCALPDRAGTVGGAICVGEDHVNAVGRGRVRSCVLQVRYVSADGRLITSGGPTVKNVTGFDLPRLITGSLGTLGALAEVTLRTNPIPLARRWLMAPDADPATVRRALYNPSCVLAGDQGQVWVLLEGHGVDVEAEAQVLAGLGYFTEAEPPALPPNRWSLSPAEALLADPAATGPRVVSALTGTVWATNPQPARDASPETVMLAERIKALFDPTGRMNPGRNPLATTPNPTLTGEEG